MTVTETLPNPREDSRDITELSISERVSILANQGLKPRDISSLLHIHPLVVVRVLERARVSL